MRTAPFSPWPPADQRMPQVRILRGFGIGMILLTVVVTATTHPSPALSGKGLVVTLALAVFLVAVFGGMPFSRRRDHVLPRLLAIMVACFALAYVQPKGLAIGGIYLVAVIAGLRLPMRVAIGIVAGSIIGYAVAVSLEGSNVGGQIASVALGVVPWFLVITMIRHLREGQVEAEELVEELRATREAHAEAAALNERGRLARDMHDVLAHSLSALSLQLEGARLLARDRDTDPEVTAGIERAHRLAASGLEEARRAIAALRGDDLPGPERLAALAEGFRGPNGARCTFTETGEPHELSSEQRMAVYRTAQEALTNVRRHAHPDRVELRLEYTAEGTSLVVADHSRINGVAPPVDPGGYGLTGMRERAELLGGRLAAGPVDGGFRVELWLPAAVAEAR